MAELDPLLGAEDSFRSEVYDKILKLLAEFVGVILFVFIGAMSVQSGSLVTIALAHGFTIALLVNQFGKISGGHFNPAVTLGVALSREITWTLAALYTVVQLLGGIIGAAFVRAILPSIVYEHIHGGAHTLADSVKPGWAILAETLLTLILVLTVLLNAVNPKTKNSFAPFAIGLAVAVDIMAAGNTTGASMNPARSFGPAIVVSPFVNTWSHHYVYWIGPALGSLFAAGFNWLFKKR